MKKRLRKKKHKGEFAVFGRQIVVRRSSSNDPQAFLDRFIEIVEANGCVCGGSSSPEVLDVVSYTASSDRGPNQDRPSE